MLVYNKLMKIERNTQPKFTYVQQMGFSTRNQLLLLTLVNGIEMI